MPPRFQQENPCGLTKYRDKSYFPSGYDSDHFSGISLQTMAGMFSPYSLWSISLVQFCVSSRNMSKLTQHADIDFALWHRFCNVKIMHVFSQWIFFLLIDSYIVILRIVYLTMLHESFISQKFALYKIFKMKYPKIHLIVTFW